MCREMDLWGIHLSPLLSLSLLSKWILSLSSIPFTFTHTLLHMFMPLPTHLFPSLTPHHPSPHTHSPHTSLAVRQGREAGQWEAVEVRRRHGVPSFLPCSHNGSSSGIVRSHATYFSFRRTLFPIPCITNFSMPTTTSEGEGRVSRHPLLCFLPAMFFLTTPA